MLPKIVFNLPFASALYATSTGHEMESLAWLATFLAYPLHTVKTILQTGSSSLQNITPSVPLLRGFVPFALINYLCAYKLTALYSPQKLASLNSELREKAKHQLGYVYH